MLQYPWAVQFILLFNVVISDNIVPTLPGKNYIGVIFYMIKVWFIISFNLNKSAFSKIYISNMAIIGSDNGLSTNPCHAIVWSNHDLLSIETNFNETWIKIS